MQSNSTIPTSVGGSQELLVYSLTKSGRRWLGGGSPAVKSTLWRCLALAQVPILISERFSISS
jgi:hypothetical protein